MQDYEVENRWLKSIQNKLKKYINSPYWDDIKLSDTYLNIICHIMNATSVNQLSPSIDERITNCILERIKNEIKRCSSKNKLL